MLVVFIHGFGGGVELWEEVVFVIVFGNCFEIGCNGFLWSVGFDENYAKNNESNICENYKQNGFLDSR